MRSFAVIPGAGVSQRMGTSKLLLPWGEKTVIEHLLAQWELSCVDHIVLVTRQSNVDDLKQERWTAFNRVHLVTPDPPPEEMKESVLKALMYIEDQWSPEPDDVWLLAPADLANLTTAMIDRVMQVFAAADEPFEMAIPRYRDKRGHPVLFTWKLAMQVSQLAATENLRSLSDKTFPRLEVAMPGLAPRDIDTWEEYEALRPPDTQVIARPG